MRFLVQMAEEDHFARWEAADAATRDLFLETLRAYARAVEERGTVVAGAGLAGPDRAVTLRRRHPHRGPVRRDRRAGGRASTWSTCRPSRTRSRPRGSCPRGTPCEVAAETVDVSERPGGRPGDRGARRLGPAAGPARRAVPPPRRRRGRPRRRGRGRGAHLAARRRAAPTRRRGCSPPRGAGSLDRCAPRRSPRAGCRSSRSRPRSPRRRSARWPTPATGSVERRAAAAGAAVRPPGPGHARHAAALTLRMVMGVPDRGHRPALPGADAHDGRTADPGPQAAGRRVVHRAGRRRAGRARGPSWPTSPTSPSPPATPPAPGADVLRADVAGEAIRLVRVLREVLPAGGRASARRPRRAARPDAAPALTRDARVGRRPGRWCCCPTRTAPAGTAPRSPRRSRLLTPLTRRAPRRRTSCRRWWPPSTRSRATAADTDWARIVSRYDELLGARRLPRGAPQPRGRGRRGRRPAAGLAALEGVDLPGHRLPAVRAELLRRPGGEDEAPARPTTRRSASCANEAELAHLLRRRVSRPRRPGSPRSGRRRAWGWPGRRGSARRRCRRRR